ncbi:toll/interleukin-1 receptor domain-containing protein [Bacteroides sp.]|uniref:toll/interleukin-1 receptor domain-containing protein n=1 Tax=Bacteroides sp. TaxID=29523 RepID=UPI002631E393|nr:toll/interleukin-1 receptor domain-containing protein [Bacteroides sp.]
MGHDVFISYSHENSEASLAICHALEQNKIKCWIAPRNIPSGSEYGDVIDDAIINCKIFVIIFSKQSSASNWVKGELNVAFTEQKHIIPYRIDETPLKGGSRLILNQYHWIDAYPDYEQKFQDLILSILSTLGRSSDISQTETTKTNDIKQTQETKKRNESITHKNTHKADLIKNAIAVGLMMSFPFINRSKKKK